MTKRTIKQPQDTGGNSSEHRLRLFVAGDEPNSNAAKASLDRIRLEHLGPDCRIEIIDVLQDSRPALEEQVLVTPALVIRGPKRRTVICGNLSDTGRVLAALHVESEKV